MKPGSRIIDRRTETPGTFNGWRLLFGKRYALAIDGRRRWWIPERFVVNARTRELRGVFTKGELANG